MRHDKRTLAGGVCKSSLYLILAVAILAFTAASLMSSTFAIPAAFAQERVARFDIPSQRLSTALLEFARQADAELLLPEAPLVGAMSTRVRGALAPSVALSRLLECTGFEGWIEDGIIRLRRAHDESAADLVVGPSPQRNGPRCDRSRGQILVSDNGPWTDAKVRDMGSGSGAVPPTARSVAGQRS